MTIAANDILRVVAKMSQQGNDVQNVYHIKVTSESDPDDEDVVDYIATVLDAAYDEIAGDMDTTLLFDTIEVWNITQDTFVGGTVWPTLSAGTNAGDPMPAQCSPLVLFNTATNRSQGRKFLPPLVAGTVDTDGSILSAALAHIALYAAYFLGPQSGVGWAFEFGNFNVDLERFVPWVYSIVRDFWATQRRRYLGSGT
jgi:hypothetical protein